MTQTEAPTPRFSKDAPTGHTQLNNQWQDEMLSQINHLGEYKVVQYIHRHTIGFHQGEVCLTIEEFEHGRKCQSGERIDRGVGLGERQVRYSIKKAVKDGYILRRVEGNNLYFSLNMAAIECTPITSEAATDCTPTLQCSAPLDATNHASQEAPQERKESKKETLKKSKKEKPTAVAPPSRKPEIVLSEKARAVYDAWCKAPWFRGVAPKLTQTVAQHCETIALCDQLPTTEDMVKTRHWYTKKYPERSGFQLGNFVDAYPQYLSDQYQPTPEKTTFRVIGYSTQTEPDEEPVLRSGYVPEHVRRRLAKEKQECRI